MTTARLAVFCSSFRTIRGCTCLARVGDAKHEGMANRSYQNIIGIVIAVALLQSVRGDLVLDSLFHHVRNSDPREWAHFPSEVKMREWQRTFDCEDPSAYHLLTLRQSNVKQTWKVTLNGLDLGVLDRDDNDLEHALPIPSGRLKTKGNNLVVSASSTTPDDIRLGQITLHRQTRDEIAREAEIVVRVTDSDHDSLLPCRLTIVDSATNRLVLLGAKSDDRLAVRPGVIYTVDGLATFGLRPGHYCLWAGRGFEYSLAKTRFEVGDGERKEIALKLTRDVDTPGLVASDTHLHTGEFARHGDASLVERLITIAGEGIELPISTEHDQHIDYTAEAIRIGANKHFTPVMGCEVTTQRGHFNSFPVLPDAQPAQHRLRQWPQVFDNIFATPGVRVVILNHPRDLHANFRPLDPAHFDAESGQFTDGRSLRTNGMEIINSGAQQSDPMRLVYDWMALLKSGHKISAVGCSDSHTVNFAIVGQARTYLPCPDEDPSKIDVATAVDGFLAGRTHVSFGLLTLLDTTEDYVTVKVLGPGWTQADKLTLFENGKKLEEIKIPADLGNRAGLKFERTWPLPKIHQEAQERHFLVAVAEGPGIAEPWWRMMPPYQKTSPIYKPYVMGISPAVWLKAP